MSETAVKEKEQKVVIDAEKQKALDMAISKIEKDFGKGSIMKLGDKSSTMVESTPTGALSLDIALGIGGVPKGRIIEIFGPESSGKTTLSSRFTRWSRSSGSNEDVPNRFA